jgi:hypothetical protein
MPIFAISIALQVACIAHVVRTGRDRIWLLAIIFLPMAGVLAYILVEILPEILGGRTTRTLSAKIERGIDPGRSVRERRRAVELADTAENRRLLAEALLDADCFDEAADVFRSALVGLHADDPALLYGLARAEGGRGHYDAALEALDQSTASSRESLDRTMFKAICLEQLGRLDEAHALYAAIVDRYPGEEARCRLAGLLAANGQQDQAQNLYAEILQRAKLADRHYRRTQTAWIERARQALAG